jgi:hypothetical protein
MMLIRTGAIAFIALLMVGCDNDKSEQEASICKGLSQSDCQAKSECVWNDEKGKCKENKAADKPKTSTLPPASETEQPSAPAAPPPQ